MEKGRERFRALSEKATGRADVSLKVTVTRPLLIKGGESPMEVSVLRNVRGESLSEAVGVRKNTLKPEAGRSPKKQSHAEALTPVGSNWVPLYRLRKAESMGESGTSCACRVTPM